MKITNVTNLKKMNFSDFEVLSTNLDKVSKTISFSFSGACHMINGKRVDLGEGYLKIVNYHAITVTSYNAKDKQETKLSEINFENLRELCELDVYEDKLVIKGFARVTCNWIEFTIIGGKITGEFEDKVS